MKTSFNAISLTVSFVLAALYVHLWLTKPKCDERVRFAVTNNTVTIFERDGSTTSICPTCTNNIKLPPL